MLQELFSNPIYILYAVAGVVGFAIILYLWLLLHNVEERLSNLEEMMEKRRKRIEKEK